MLKHATFVLPKETFEVVVSHNAKENSITWTQQLVLQIMSRGRMHFSQANSGFLLAQNAYNLDCAAGNY